VDQRIRTRTLTRIAEEAVPDTVDLWPVIRAQVDRPSLAPPMRPTSAPTMPGRRRTLLAGIGSAAMLVLAPAGLVTWWSQPTAVSAETILDRAQATASNRAEIKTYHLKMIGSRGGTTVDIEVWYGGSTKQRSVNRPTGSGAAAVPSTETVFNGEHAWIILTENGRTRAVHTVGTDWNKPGGDPAKPGSLTDVLASYTSEKSCLDARLDGETTVAGRPAYQIITAPKREGCDGPSRAEADDQKLAMLGEMRIWVDKESFLLLKSETRDRSGAVLKRGEVTSIEFNVSIPDSVFTYTPPPGVQVREFIGATPDVVKRALFEDESAKQGGTASPRKP
jgi:outer membrane lipoprotein-sorting protein